MSVVWMLAVLAGLALACAAAVWRMTVARMLNRAEWIALTAGMTVAVAIAAGNALPHEPTPSLPPAAPGYSYDVQAAAYHVCGDLTRGATVDEVTANARRDGISGDLYTADSVQQVMAYAVEQVCPEVAR